MSHRTGVVTVFTSCSHHSSPWRDIIAVIAWPFCADLSVASSTLNNIVIARMTPGISSCFTINEERSTYTAVMTPRNGWRFTASAGVVATISLAQQQTSFPLQQSHPQFVAGAAINAG